jgi:hypothetical protein
MAGLGHRSLLQVLEVVEAYLLQVLAGLDLCTNSETVKKSMQLKAIEPSIYG